MIKGISGRDSLISLAVLPPFNSSIDDRVYGPDIRRVLKNVISDWRSLRPDLFQGTHQMTTSEELSKTLYSDNTQEFMTLANSLATEGTTESVDVLLACFEDDDDYYDEMSVLMHAIERIDPTPVYESLSKGLPDLNDRAPGWSEELVKRHLSVPGIAKEGGFSISAFVCALREVPESLAVAKSIASRLVSDERIPADVLYFFT